MLHFNLFLYRYDIYTWGQQDIHWQHGQFWENGEFLFTERRESMFYACSFLSAVLFFIHVCRVSKAVFCLFRQRIIANTIRQVRHCRSQPFSKSAYYSWAHFYPLICWPCRQTVNNLSSQCFFCLLYLCLMIDPDICQPNKNQAEVRGYVRKLCVIDNQRALTQLSYRLEPRRTWAPDPPPQRLLCDVSIKNYIK